MNIFYLSLSLSVSLLFTITYKPFHLAVMLLFQTIIITLMVSMLNLWYAFTLILIFMGGMMIIIFYSVSLTFDKMNFKVKNFMFLFPPLFSALIFLFSFMASTDLTTLPNSSKSLSINQTLMELSIPNMNSFFAFQFILVYLLITLFLLSMILKKNKGPLRMNI